MLSFVVDLTDEKTFHLAVIVLGIGGTSLSVSSHQWKRNEQGQAYAGRIDEVRSSRRAAPSLSTVWSGEGFQFLVEDATKLPLL